MLAPQSDEEVRPVVEALRRLDPLLDIRWNPRNFKRRGVFDALGQKTDDKWEGRWEIIRHNTANLHEDRDWARITTVTEIVRNDDGVDAMVADGAYAPVGMYLVAYMELWDRAQAHFIEAMDSLGKEHDRAEAIQHSDHTAGHQDALEKVYREHGGGQFWAGRGFGPGQRSSLILP